MPSYARHGSAVRESYYGIGTEEALPRGHMPTASGRLPRAAQNILVSVSVNFLRVDGKVNNTVNTYLCSHASVAFAMRGTVPMPTIANQ